MKKIIFKKREKYKWDGRTYEFIASQENNKVITKKEFKKLNIIDDIDKLKNYDIGIIILLLQNAKKGQNMNKVKKIILDDLKLTEKQKKELEKIKKYLEKENEKAREHQKIRGVR